MNDPHKIINGVLHLTPEEKEISKYYTDLREKEGRLLKDHEVKILPDTENENPNKKEWELRKRSSERFIQYLKAKNKPLSVLDVGCGNGWFSNKMALLQNGITVVGLDINKLELEQAALVFSRNNLEFVYGDLFEIDEPFFGQFSIITLNAAIQYFENPDELFSKLKTFLKPNGEIHIIDSPFYQNSEIEEAKKRSQDYYISMGAPEMSDHYFHHSIESVKAFDIMYRPSQGVFHKLFGKKDSPFIWFRSIN